MKSADEPFIVRFNEILFILPLNIDTILPLRVNQVLVTFQYLTVIGEISSNLMMNGSKNNLRSQMTVYP